MGESVFKSMNFIFRDFLNILYLHIFGERYCDEMLYGWRRPRERECIGRIQWLMDAGIRHECDGGIIKISVHEQEYHCDGECSEIFHLKYGMYKMCIYLAGFMCLETYS